MDIRKGFIEIIPNQDIRISSRTSFVKHLHPNLYLKREP